MGIKLEIGGYYKLSDGRVVGPATTWCRPDVVDHYFELPVTSASGNKETIFKGDGTTDYADFHVVQRAANHAFVEAGAFYKTADGVTVGPMVGPDAFGRFTSAGNELSAIRNDGVPLGSHQKWKDNGVVMVGNEHEKGHRLVERVSAPAPDTEKPVGSNKQELTLKVDMSEANFLKAFNATTTEFVNRLNETQAEISKRDAEIERLTAACNYYQTCRNEWFDAWERTSEMKLRGDNRLRLARSRYKVARENAAIHEARVGELLVKVSNLEKAEVSKKVKAVVDFIGGTTVLAAVAVATYLVAVA